MPPLQFNQPSLSAKAKAFSPSPSTLNSSLARVSKKLEIRTPLNRNSKSLTIPSPIQPRDPDIASQTRVKTLDPPIAKSQKNRNRTDSLDNPLARKPLPKDSPAYPFSNNACKHTNPQAMNDIPPNRTKPISMNDILSNPLLSDTKPAPDRLVKLFNKALPCPCSLSSLPCATAGRSAHQANRDLRKMLIFDLKHSQGRSAFSSFLPEEDVPRADDLEALMFSFPGLQDLDYDNPPPIAESDLDLALWHLLHSKHCSNNPVCTKDLIAKSCYFYPLHYMMKYGYHAHLEPGSHLSDIKTHPAAYIHLWQKDEVRCLAAFEKLLNSTDLKPITDPPLIFPLLPTYRKKHIWRFNKFGVDYLPRLASDISTSGGNKIFSPWLLRYLALHAVCKVISRGDYLATRDITGFYNRLPAGPLLKMLQCFQDPRSYRSSSAKNKEAVNKKETPFLQQQSCMFGHRQLPAWASCVSSELARILHNECIRVAGVLIDDFLFHSPASEGPESMQAQLRQADSIMKKLGVPPNNKGQGPSTSVVFSGIRVDSVAGHFSVDEEQREYVIQRLSDILKESHCATKDLESVNGSLGWLCFVIHHGRCRRDVIQKASNSKEKSIPVSKPLKRQLQWWLEILTNKAFRPSPIWFRDEVQRSLKIQSDASGDQGFGFCAAGFHVTGCWRPSLAPIIQHDMFVKELIPVTIAILLLHTVLPNHIFGPALDNAGATCRINCGSCRSPLGRRLLTAIADALWASDSDILADWNSRDHPLAQHADILSKILSEQQWAKEQNSANPPWIFDLIIQGGSPRQTMQTSIRIPRLAESLPEHLRHRSQAYRNRLAKN